MKVCFSKPDESYEALHSLDFEKLGNTNYKLFSARHKKTVVSLHLSPDVDFDI